LRLPFPPLAPFGEYCELSEREEAEERGLPPGTPSLLRLLTSTYKPPATKASPTMPPVPTKNRGRPGPERIPALAALAAAPATTPEPPQRVGEGEGEEAVL
jgi:hypothetical protein